MTKKADVIAEYKSTGKSLADLSRQFGVSATTIHTWVDPRYAAKRRTQINKVRNKNRLRRWDD